MATRSKKKGASELGFEAQSREAADQVWGHIDASYCKRHLQNRSHFTRAFARHERLSRRSLKKNVSQQVEQANVNGTKIKAFSVPFPRLAEQKRIVAGVERRLSVVKELEAVVFAIIERTDRLRDAILGIMINVNCAKS